MGETWAAQWMEGVSDWVLAGLITRLEPFEGLRGLCGTMGNSSPLYPESVVRMS